MGKRVYWAYTPKSQSTSVGSQGRTLKEGLSAVLHTSDQGTGFTAKEVRQEPWRGFVIGSYAQVASYAV